MIKPTINNKILLILSLFLIFLVIGTASAVDDDSISTNDTLTVDDAVSDDIVSTDTNENTDELSEGDSDIGSFSDLNQYIQDNKGYDKTIKLNKNYKFNNETDSQFKYGINLPGYVTIDGQGHSIVTQDETRVFMIENCNVTLKNIVFKDSWVFNEPILVTGENAVLQGLSFNNVSGSSISTTASALHITVKDSTFNNVGKAVMVASSSFTLENLLISNTYGDFALRIASSADNIDYNQIEKFIKNVTIINARAGGIYIHTPKVTLENVKILNSSSNSYGTIIQAWGGATDLKILNCDFINNTQITNGGTVYGMIYLKVGGSLIEGCRIMNNTGDAYLIHYHSTSGTVNNSNFTYNEIMNVFASNTPTLDDNCDITTGNTVYDKMNHDEFSKYINDHMNDEIIYLGKNYTVLNTITISKTDKNSDNIVIDGRGHTIDANGMKAFRIEGNKNNNLILRNITIKNGNGEGAALYAKNINVYLDNCNIINNTGSSIIRLYTCRLKEAKNCNFINNSITYYSIFYGTGVESFVKCNFIENKGTTKLLFSAGSDVTFTDCIIDGNNVLNGYLNGGNPNINLVNTNVTNNALGNLLLFSNGTFVKDDKSIIQGNYDPNELQNELQDLIDKNLESGIINLDKNYTAVKLISITKDNLVIDGHGFVIDGNGTAELFNISGTNITIKNIIFKNFRLNDLGDRSPIILLSGKNFLVNNCTFINNTGDSWWPAIKSLNDLKVTNCDFIDNVGYRIIRTYGHLNLSNSNFIRNRLIGSDISVKLCYASNYTLSNLNFTNNIADDSNNIIYPLVDCNNSWVNGVKLEDYLEFIMLFTNLTDGDTIKLNKNYTAYSLIQISNNNIVIDGQGHTVDVKAIKLFTLGGENVTIKNITIKNGKNPSTYEFYRTGGVIIMTGLNAVVEDSIFINNTAINGGVLFFNKDDAKVDHCVFINNTAYNYAGAIYFSRNGTLTNSRFVNNKADTGGAVYMFNDGIIRNCTFEDNEATAGGAIISNKNLDCDNCTFVNNSACKAAGILAQGEDTVLNNLIFVNNTAEHGMVTSDVDSFVATNIQFINNSATHSGAGIVTSTDNSKLTNITTWGNEAPTGSSLIVDADGAEIVNSTFTENFDDEDGATVVIKGQGSKIMDSVISDNYGNGIDDIANGTVITGNNITNNRVGVVLEGNDTVLNDNNITGNSNETGDVSIGNESNMGDKTDEIIENNTVGNVLKDIMLNVTGVSPSIIHVDDNIVLTMTINNKNGTVRVTVNGREYNIAANDGNIKAVIDNIPIAGDYNIIVEVLPSAEYNVDSTVIPVHVQNWNFTELQDIIDKAINDNTTAELGNHTYVREDGEDPIKINETVKVNGNDATIDVNNGTCAFDVDANGVELNNMTIINVNNGTAIDVVGNDTKISDITLTNNTGTGIKVEGNNNTVEDTVGNNHTGTLVAINGNDNNINNSTANGGNGTIVDILAGNNNTIDGINTTNHDGKSVNDNGTNTTLKNVKESAGNPDIAFDLSKANANPSVFTVNLPKDATGTFTVMIGGKEYKETVKNGTATISIPNLPAGVDTPVVLRYSGDDKYGELYKTATVKVPTPKPTTENTVIVAKKKITIKKKKRSKTKKFTVTLKTIGGKPVAGQKVYFKLDKKILKKIKSKAKKGKKAKKAKKLLKMLKKGKYAVTTKANGKATLKLKKSMFKFKKGKGKLTVTFKGVAGKYYASKKIVKIVMK